MKIRITGNVIGLEIDKNGIADTSKKEADRLIGLGVAERVTERAAAATSSGNSTAPAGPAARAGSGASTRSSADTDPSTDENTQQ